MKKKRLIPAILMLLAILWIMPGKTAQVQAATKRKLSERVKISGFSVEKSSATSATVKWTRLSSDTYKITGYRVYKATSKYGKYKQAGEVSYDRRSCKVRGMIPGYTYYFKVRAYYSKGSKNYYSAYTTPKSITFDKLLTLKSGKTHDWTISNTSSTAQLSVTDKKVISIKKISATKYRITANKPGTAYATVKIGRKQYKCKVTVPKIKSASEAVSYVRRYLKAHKKSIPPIMEFDGMRGGSRYSVHGYEWVNQAGSSHTATWFWYSVTPTGRIYDDVFCKYIY